jgi:hypothetical protein
MIRDTDKLLPGTVVVNRALETGTLKSMRYSINGKLCWCIDWTNRGLELVAIEDMHDYVLL